MSFRLVPKSVTLNDLERRNSRKATWRYFTDFKAKMHQIVCRLGLRPRLRWGSLQRSPDPVAGFQGAYFEGKWKGREKKEGEGRVEKGRKGKGGGEKRG